MVHHGAPLLLDEITVTATKTHRGPLETSGEVNVIHRNEIDRVQAQSLDDVLRYQPGLDIGGGPRRLVEAPSIRGLSGPRVLVTLDGARLDFQSGHAGRLFVEVDALRQIDVVRGPNSALWGSGALGGVLALSTLDVDGVLRHPGRQLRDARGGLAPLPSGGEARSDGLGFCVRVSEATWTVLRHAKGSGGGVFQ